LKGVLEIFHRRPGYIYWISWRYLTVILEIIDACNGDSRRVVSRELMSVLGIFDRCPGDI